MTTFKNLVLATAMVLPASTLIAQDVDEHLVIIENRGYYPAKVYVQPGDTIVFRNNSSNWVRLYSEDPFDDLAGYVEALEDGDLCSDPDDHFSGDKDGFSQGWFSVGSERSVSVSSCMETRMFAPEVYNNGGTNWSARYDLVVFGEAPNG